MTRAPSPPLTACSPPENVPYGNTPWRPPLGACRPPAPVLGGGGCYFHFIGKDTEAPRGGVTGPRSRRDRVRIQSHVPTISPWSRLVLGRPARLDLPAQPGSREANGAEGRGGLEMPGGSAPRGVSQGRRPGLTPAVTGHRCGGDCGRQLLCSWPHFKNSQDFKHGLPRKTNSPASPPAQAAAGKISLAVPPPTGALARCLPGSPLGCPRTSRRGLRGGSPWSLPRGLCGHRGAPVPGSAEARVRIPALPLPGCVALGERKPISAATSSWGK